MTIPDDPPRGLRWTATGTMRGVTTLVSIIALLAAIFVGVQQQLYIHCVGANQSADARRTSAIAVATDAERRADRALLAATRANAEALRVADVAARAHTDAVRAENPPEPAGQC